MQYSTEQNQSWFRSDSHEGPDKGDKNDTILWQVIQGRARIECE